MKSKVRLSCHALLASPGCPVRVSEQGIDAFLANLDQSAYLAVVASEKQASSYPLRFADSDARLNWYATLHLLNFGSGYRTALRRACGKGAFESIIHLLVAVHVSGTVLDAGWMSGIDAHTVAEFIGLNMVTETPHATLPAVYDVTPSDTAPLMHAIAGALNTTGDFLAARGHGTLFGYVRESAAAAANIDDMLDRLAQIPALDDRYTIAGVEVQIMKKAQIMLGELTRQGMPVPWLNDGDLCVYADNVLPTMLQLLGVIDAPETEARRDADEPIAAEQAVYLRAASIVACERIYEEALRLGKSWLGSEVDLDHYLWKVAKEPQYRSRPRYRVPDTVMF